MKTIADILKDFNPIEDKYVSRDFQAFGIDLSEQLEDYKRRGLYIKLAKKYPRPALEKALSFVKDSKARNKAALFMWKLKKMGVFRKTQTQKKARPFKAWPSF